MNIVLIFLLLVCYKMQAQFVQIKSPDGYVNVRSQPEKGNNIIDSLKNGDIVAVFEDYSDNPNWVFMLNRKSGEELNKVGYIYKDRFLHISKNAPLKKTLKINQLDLSYNQLGFTFKTEKFNPKNNKITYEPIPESYPPSQSITKINGTHFYGTDGMMPQTQYKSITGNYNKKMIDIPVTSYHNLYNPNLENTAAYYQKSANTIFIETNNSEGAGWYSVLWVVKDDKFIERIIVNNF